MHGKYKEDKGKCMPHFHEKTIANRWYNDDEGLELF